ncbi:MAG TPA: hypothetical protein VMK66_05660 [Myxococcales bacterium]|nr:hypothetical protein [Myxococcales bacterium]
MNVISRPWRAALTVIALWFLLMLFGVAAATSLATPAAAVPGIHSRPPPPVLAPQGDAISNETGDLPQLD